MPGFASQKSGSANLPLHYGAPPWLFQRMARLSREWLPEPSTTADCC